MSLSLTDADRNLFAAILIKEDEELTAESIEGAARALRRKTLNRRLKEIEHALDGPNRVADRQQRLALAEERLRVKRALRDPGLAHEESPSPAA